MVNTQVKNKLKEAAKLLSEVLTELEGTTTAVKSRLTESAPKSPSSLPERIIALRDAGFFRVPKTAEEVHAELQDSAKDTYYHCEPDRVVMALLRLLKRGELRKVSKKDGIEVKKKIAYVW